MANFDEETAAEESRKEMAEYKKSRGIPPETKIFKILGKYHTLRDEFERRGWVEHDWEEIQDPMVTESFNSLAFDFLYTRQGKDVFRLPLAPHQQVNHILGQNSMTTKVGLTHNMKNLVWKQNMDIARVFP